MNSHIVLGTAGHVDHGKTAFIRHLTGIETDRLKDEQERGITIENGYAHLALPSGLTVGFVDVPGHERFIKTMLSGAMGIDAFIMIIAADEGIKPQTLEHFNILKHLDIQEGFFLITKSDLVDAARLSHLEEEIKHLTENSIFVDKPILHYSIFDLNAKQNVIDEIEKIAIKTIEKKEFYASRLNIDRIFSVKGYGTVVTGTLLEGQIKKGEHLTLYPSGKKCRVKGVQVYGKSVDIAQFGQRTALNISLDLDEVNKGDTLTSIQSFNPTMIIDVSFTTDEITHEIKHWQRLKLYHGTKEILCRIVTGIDNTIQSFETHNIQLRLETPIYCKANDPFILRSYSPMVTLGGGHITSPYAKKRVIDLSFELEDNFVDSNGFTRSETNEFLSVLESNEVIFTLNDAVFEKSSFTRDKVNGLFENLIQSADVICLYDARYILAKNWSVMVDVITYEILSEHKTYPLRSGIQKETLKSKIQSRIPQLKFNKQDFSFVIQKLVQDEVAIDYTLTVALKSHRVVYSNLEKTLIDQILRLVETHQQGVVPIDDVINLNSNKIIVKEVLYHLINSEILVKINDKNIMSATLYKDSFNLLVNYFESHPSISVAEFRDLIGLSRKATVILLEHFDTIQLTKRNENTRTLIKR